MPALQRLTAITRLIDATGIAAAFIQPATAACDFSDANSAIRNVLAADGISAAGVIIGSPQGIWFEQYFGAFDDTTVVPLASASRLLAGFRVMRLVDQGVLDLDAPLSSYLGGALYPWSSTAAPITLRQRFSHTAGYGDDEADSVLADDTIALAQSVQKIAANVGGLSQQNYPPVGSLFAYGDVSMQIAGGVAEARSGVDRQQGWKAAVGAPMCINTIDWRGLGPTANYHISGRGRAGLEHDARVLAMLAGGGVGNGTRIRSPASIAILNHSQTGNAAPFNPRMLRAATRNRSPHRPPRPARRCTARAWRADCPDRPRSSSCSARR